MREFRLPALLVTGLIGMGLIISHRAIAQQSAEPTGASAAFTSDDPVVLQARGLVDAGKFSEAEALLNDTGRGQAGARRQMLDIIQRIRVAYALESDVLLERVRQSIPDVSSADLEKWRSAGQVQYRMIDGKALYFGREPANLFRFCDEAKRRRRPAPQESAPLWTLQQHLARVIAAADQKGAAHVVPIRHRIKYTLTVSPQAPHLTPGALVRVWLPFPQEHERQFDVKLLGTSPSHAILAPPTAPQRTIYFEQRAPDPIKPMTFEETFEFTSSAYYPELDQAKTRPLPANWAGGNLSERPPHIVFTPQLKQTVAQIVGDETNPLTRARKIFHWICGNIAYCAEKEYSTIPSLSAKAFSSRRGDCGVQSMLFITMCRAAGIPARWQSGWQTKRVSCDMHDWAEFYVEPWGWLPADPSYGLQDSPDPRIREFYFGHLDSYRMIVNRDYGCELDPPTHSLRSEPLDFQRGEVEIDGNNLYFPYWDYDIRIDYLTEGP